MLDLFYRFGSSPNWDGYCNLEVDKVVERYREAQAAGVGDRAKTGRGRRSANHLLQPLCILLAASGEKLDDDGQQHHQQFSSGRRLVGQIADRRVLVLLKKQ
jgi:hypothetical protein